MSLCFHCLMSAYTNILWYKHLFVTETGQSDCRQKKTSKALPFSDGTCLHVVYIIYKLEYDFFTFKYLLNLFNEWLIKCYYIMLCKNICLNEHLSTDKVFNQIYFPIVFVVLQHTLTIKGSEWVGPFLFQILWDSNQHICRY